MSSISYRGIDLKIVHSRFVDRTYQRSPDGADYTVTRWTIDVDCIFNPSATSYQLITGQNLNTPPPAGQVFPALTDTAIQAYLATSRGKLIYRSGVGAPNVQRNWVESPIGNNTVDAYEGPQVESCTVKEIAGEKTFMVNLRITTWLRPCDYDPSESKSRLARKAILSNRWTQTHSVDEDYFTTVTTQGVAIFRKDILQLLQASPDQFRQNLVVPIPYDFKRDHIEVQVNSEANSVFYTIVDRHKCYNWPAESGATRVEAYRTSGYSRTGLGQNAISATGDLVNSNLNIAQNAAGSFIQSGGNPLAAGASILLSGIGNGMSNMSNAVQRVVPQYYDTVFVRVWGHRGSARRNLFDLGMSIVAGILGTGVLGPGSNEWTNMEFWTSQQLNGKFVEISCTQKAGLGGLAGGVFTRTNIYNLIASFLTGGPVAAGGVAGNLASAAFSTSRFFDARFPVDENIGVHLTQIQQANIAPTGDRKSRGNWLGMMVHQSLKNSPCEQPDHPPGSYTNITIDSTMNY